MHAVVPYLDDQLVAPDLDGRASLEREKLTPRHFDLFGAESTERC